ncbi:MAG: hypothetical protein HY692_05040 [Cyanobacteria bacterium NC_groundwater_1444_Ag_S-0.65um_54_12]|nr:hypothetical protein [Cyanobacteria bacterium NC_groundwater_1444_Ag_S-0.65um_54_12]
MLWLFDKLLVNMIAAGWLLIALPGCDLGLRQRAPQLEERWQLEPREVNATAFTLLATSSYWGPGERIVTSRSILGNVQRVVNPYGEDNIIFRLQLHNTGKLRATLRPQEATLQAGGRVLAALTLEDYKRNWPTYPIVNAEIAKDQAAAFTFVLRSMLLERQIMPDERVGGRLAFPAPAGAKGDVILRLPVDQLASTATLSFTFSVQPVTTARVWAKISQID